jgi:CHRD domain
MKRFAVCAIAMLALVGVACDDDNPNGPSDQNTVVFIAPLSAANEVPAVTGAEASVTGTATITFHLTRDASNNITAATADFNATLSNLPAGVVGTAAHIHPGVTGTTGNPLINTGATAANFNLPQGNGSFTATGVTVTPVDSVNQVIANPAGFYFNIHSQANSGGFARGQLVLQQ